MQLYLVLLVVKSLAWRLASRFLLNMDFIRWLWSTKWGKRSMIITVVALVLFTYIKCS